MTIAIAIVIARLMSDLWSLSYLAIIVSLSYLVYRFGLPVWSTGPLGFGIAIIAIIAVYILSTDIIVSAIMAGCFVALHGAFRRTEGA